MSGWSNWGWLLLPHGWRCFISPGIPTTPPISPGLAPIISVHGPWTTGFHHSVTRRWWATHFGFEPRGRGGHRRNQGLLFGRLDLLLQLYLLLLEALNGGVGMVDKVLVLFLIVVIRFRDGLDGAFHGRRVGLLQLLEEGLPRVLRVAHLVQRRWTEDVLVLPELDQLVQFGHLIGFSAGRSPAKHLDGHGFEALFQFFGVFAHAMVQHVVHEVH